MQRSVSAVFLIPLLGAISLLPGTSRGDERLEFFEEKIRPVLVEKCYQCHAATSEKLKGGLYLDHRQGLVEGGDSGPAIVPGDPEASLLIESIRYADPDLEMPPKERLPEEVVRDFERWIAMGAPDPRETPSGEKSRNVLYREEDAETHWAFQPVRQPEVPRLEDPWVRNPIDAFVLKRLRDAGLKPSGKAPRPVLLRRLSFDLTGLPYTGEAETPDEAIEELLASEQYGVHWGRHWLDIARYADHNGGRLAPSAPSPYYPFAWTYRDWVIEAFNGDMPYDEFVLHQLAGDAFAGEGRREPLAGLGFLRVGRQFGQNLDDRIDDRIDAISKGFLGLTVTCARCHDHKFDPVYAADYYAWHGILKSSEDIEVDLIDRETIPGYAEYRAGQAAEIAEIRRDCREKFESLVAGFLGESDRLLLVAQRFLDGELGQSAGAAARELKIEADIFEAFVGALEKWRDEENRVFVPWFRLRSFDEGEYRKIEDGAWEVHPVVAEGLLQSRPANRTELAEFYRDLTLAVGERAGGHYPIVELIMNCDNLQRNWKPAEYDPFATAPAPLDDSEWEELRQVLLGFEGAWGGKRLPPRKLMRSGGGDILNPLKMALAEHTRLDGADPRAPVAAMAVRDLEKPENSNIYIRGSRDNLGAEVPRAWLAHLSYPGKKPYSQGSGRLELARDIVSRENPLTARVMVNRIWQWHFGTGLVSTASDFGLNGVAPSHPELLDWLATWFMDRGWSVRELNRLIVASNTWQQSSHPRRDGAEIDPANVLLWRMSPRQLQFEEMRDAMLLASGELDPAVGGRPVPGGRDSARRTAFLFVDRYDLPYEFQIFDFANPDFSTAKRESAIVPQQALFFLNHPWVEERARNAVSRAVREGGTNEGEQLRVLWRNLLHREPEERELAAATEHLRATGGAIDQVAHALFSSNGFVFVR